MMIDEKEILLAQKCLEIAKEAGASDARVDLCKDTTNEISTLDGQVDKVSSSQDRSIYITLFVDGRYGSFSTNKIDEASLKDFILKSIETVRMLAPDPCRALPDQERVCKNAKTGRELGLVDEEYFKMTPDRRRKFALDGCITGKTPADSPAKLVSEEGSYSDEMFDELIIDSRGTYCRQTSTSFSFYTELTVEDDKGNRYSAYWWDDETFLDKLDWKGCAQTAFKRAEAMLNPRKSRSRKCNMVVDNTVSYKMITPLLRAINGYGIQQHNSFLEGKLGEKVFSEGLTIKDAAHLKGCFQSRLFDSEGVATNEHDIISDGVIKEYFINTYMSGKLQMAPTAEEAVRPYVPGWPREGLNQGDILKICDDGILVTDFNGGNSNPATGDFSFGIEGFAFKNGKISGPVREMLVTGNFISLWNNFVAAGSDPLGSMSKLIPTLAFSNVDFNG